MRRGLLSDEDLQKLLDDEDALEQFLQKVVERLVREGYLTHDRGPALPRSHRRAGGGCGPAGPPIKFELTEKGVGLPRLQDAARPAGLAGQVVLRPPRHARPRHRRRGLRALEGLRVRRHPEPRRQRHAALRRGARGAEGPARRGLQGPARPPDRVPVLLRDGGDARLLAQHDPVRRGPLHAGQEGGPRPVAT